MPNKYRDILQLLAIIFAYTILIDFLFFQVCEKFNNQEGYSCYVTDTSYIDNFSTLFFALTPVFILPKKIDRPSTLINWLLFFIHYLPSIITYPHMLVEQVSWWRPLILIVFISMILSGFQYRKLNLKIKWIQFEKTTWAFVLLFCFYCIAVVSIIFDHGLPVDVPNISNVYEQREIYKENISHIGGYIGSISGYFLAPFLLLLAIIFFKRQHQLLFIFYSCASIFLTFLIYASSGLKSVAFSSFITLIAYIFIKKYKYNILFFPSTILATLICSLFLSFLSIDIVAFHWIRRIFLVPGMNVNYFFDYFTKNDYKPWNNAPLIVSEKYYGTSGSANSGFIGEALAKNGFSVFLRI